jgi:hypothetical protein
MREVDRINKKLWLLSHNLVGNQKGGRNVSFKIKCSYSMGFRDVSNFSTITS